MDWKYERTEAEFKKIPVGRYRCRIEGAEAQTSKAGNDMIKLTLAISGQSRKIWDYIVFMPDNAEITNRKLTAIFDSFGIEEGNFDFQSWVGKVGACMVKIDENEYEKVNYYIKKSQQDTLPNWIEPTSDGTPQKSEFSPMSDDEELPF